MGLFGSIFNTKNQIDEKLVNITLLRGTMRQNEAQIQTRNLISDLMQRPSLINGIKMHAEFGNYLTNELNNFQRTDELQFITELAFFVISKALNREIHPFTLYDRLFIMYNAEDFLMDTIKEANELHYKPLSWVNSMHGIKWQAEDILVKMRYHDLFCENKFYPNGTNDSSFNGQEFIEISEMIIDGRFELRSEDEFAQNGKSLIDKCYFHIGNKFSLNI